MKKDTSHLSLEQALPMIREGKKFRFRRRPNEPYTTWLTLKEFNHGILVTPETEFQIYEEPRELFLYKSKAFGVWTEAYDPTAARAKGYKVIKVREVINEE